jgi:hypothetical protein
MDTLLHAVGIRRVRASSVALAVAVDTSSTCASGTDRERITGTGDVERFATSEAAGSIDAN